MLYRVFAPALSILAVVNGAPATDAGSTDGVLDMGNKMDSEQPLRENGASLHSDAIPGPKISRRPAGAPWANDAAEIVIMVSTARGASTETAEALGSTHPCSASFNEVLKYSNFPVGYDRYRQDQSYKDYFSPCPLSHHRWLQDAVTARSRFCAGRPQEVRDVCGSVCVVVLKMHLDAFIDNEHDPAWTELIMSKHVRAAVIERNERDTFCSIQRSQVSNDWGHTPSESTGKVSRKDIPCDETSAAADDFVHKVQLRFNTTRELLGQKEASSWIELPFNEYIADVDAGRTRLYELAGLQMPPNEWRDTCGLDWCAHFSWPSTHL